ncbi:MAG TPA: NADH:ubiquinone reductase (Na(+)-transporting) subunit C [Bacteroidales bacterium]|nr:NADH:ubiquinone reductase (Na(+)-transporting) subunit C [Bacteroidales bacterium]
MKEFSSKYIFIFSIVMVIIVAVLLSLAATLLQPRQSMNVEIDKKKGMLESIGVPSTPETTQALYDKYVKGSFVVNTKGEEVTGIDAFTVDLRAEQRKPEDEQYLPVFNAETDNGEKLLILPLQGKGLWGPIWGYVSIKSDHNTIFGATFDHKGETPGLGAEINTTSFESMFQGKQLFEKDEFVSIGVLKGGARDDDPHNVDAISGGTITSKGLERMLYTGIGKYNQFFLKNKSEDNI